MTAILTCGLPQLPVDLHPDNLVQVEVGTDDAEALVELGNATAPVIQDGDTVIALVPTWDNEPALRRLQTLRTALDTTHLVLHPTPLPPLAAAAFATLLAECASHPDVATADLLPRLVDLEASIVGAAWLGSVVGLRWPSPSLGQHARSLLPRSRHAGLVDDNPRIVTVAKDQGTIPLPGPDEAGWRAFVAAGDGDLACVERSLAEVVPDERITRTSMDPISSTWWSTAKLVELALRPDDVQVVIDYLIAQRPALLCSWCGEAVSDTLCPFCGMRQPRVRTAALLDTTNTPLDRTSLGAPL